MHELNALPGRCKCDDRFLAWLTRAAGDARKRVPEPVDNSLAARCSFFGRFEFPSQQGVADDVRLPQVADILKRVHSSYFAAVDKRASMMAPKSTPLMKSVTVRRALPSPSPSDRRSQNVLRSMRRRLLRGAANNCCVFVRRR